MSTTDPRLPPSSPRLHKHASSIPTTPSPLPPSHATHCSLRVGDARFTTAHPLRQNPPSVHESEHYASFDDIPLTASPSALTSRSTHYDPHAESASPLNDDPDRPPLGHQRSLTSTFFDNCKPLVNKATSTLQQQYNNRASFHSPDKSLASLKSTLETTASQPKIRAGKKLISDWFNGESSPVSIGISLPSPSKEQPQNDYDSGAEEGGKMLGGIFNRGTASNPTTPQQSTPAQRPATASTSTPSNKFSWLLNTQKNASNPPEVPSPAYHNTSDELLTLNISQALFPHGPVDPLAPSSFHDLLTIAENLLTRYQSSYRALSSALNDARAEQSAQDDELDGAETRVRHLKMQLETMAERANEQDKQMQQLMSELRLERQQRKEEEQLRKRSVALVRGPTCSHSDCKTLPHWKRESNNSEISVDSGFESENESEAASIFSRSNGAMSPVDTIGSSVLSDHETTPRSKRPQQLQRTSTYDRVRNGTVDIEGGWGCANCEGGAQSAVWGRLARERDENRLLRHRVDELEKAVDGALNIVDGPWGMA